MSQKALMKSITKKKIGIGLICIVIVAVTFVLFFEKNKSSRETYVYKETKVEFGTLIVGVTESGTVDIGTVEQTFDLDMSALKRVETGTGTSNGIGFGGSSGMGNMNGMGNMAPTMGNGNRTNNLNMFSQMLGGGSNLIGSGDASSLTIGNVLVSVGQNVKEGDVLFELAEDSVAELEQELQDNVGKAKADLDAVYADQKLSKQTAKSTYESSIAYGDYAQTEYDATIQQLKEEVESNRVTLKRAQATLQEYQNRLADITDSYNDAQKAQSNFQYSLDHTDPSDAYMYSYYFQYVQETSQTVESLKKQKEQLENNVEQAQGNIETAKNNYAKAQRNQEQGLLSAKQTLALRQLAYDTAQETYDITLAYLEEDALTQEEIYHEACEKWEEFSSYISGNSVLARYNGVITGVELAKGDSITTGSTLVTLYNLDEVTMTVSVYEQDMASVKVGAVANISFTAYPNDLYTATVSEISDASTDSKGNVVYEVTVTINGDTTGLFQGMTGDITFITEQSEETFYVSKRAIITEEEKTYVKIRQENGNVVKKAVTTGFSDGRNIQILEGVSEGDVVLIESKVSES